MFLVRLIWPLRSAEAFLVFLKVERARKEGVDMAEFPIISRLEQRLSQLDAFKAAHPSAQADFPHKEAQ